MTKDIQNIYSRLLRNITIMKYKPGTKLGEVEISEKYHVSRTPIRDVFKQLESDGLLEIRSKSGSFVTKINLCDISDHMFIRSAIENQVLQEVKGKLTEADIKYLRRNLISQEKITFNKTFSTPEAYASAIFDLDNDFHKYIFTKVNKGSVLQLINDETPCYQRFRFLSFLRDDNDINGLLKIHNEMLSAIENNEECQLAEIVHKHNYSIFEGVDKIKGRHPDFFVD
ncbi:MAG: GntR family transcriptional regulator [Bacilli bacterium]